MHEISYDEPGLRLGPPSILVADATSPKEEPFLQRSYAGLDRFAPHSLKMNCLTGLPFDGHYVVL